MKASLVILVSAVILGCQAVSNDDVLKQWTEFQVKFGKTYKSPVENRHRLSVFKNNLEKIEAHNALYKQGLETYEQGITKFADWTSEEFTKYVNKFPMKPRKQGNKLFKASAVSDVPAYVDWRSQGAVREVKDQGSCGSCWSFSATGAMEGLATLKRGLNISLSEQYLIDCAGMAYGNLGCQGGLMDGAFVYVEFYGCDTEANYPYKAVQGDCRPAPKDAFTIDGYTDVEATEETLKQAVANVGPVSVAIEATSNLQHYRSGIIYDESCTPNLNHGVLAVGYGTENGQDYWLIKNSWGAAWGEEGFFKLARNRGNNCGVANMASYPNP